MSKNHWSTEFAQKKVQKGRESLRRSLFVALYTKYLQYSIGNHLIWNGLSKSQIQEYPVISQLWILWITTFNTQLERDNVELPPLPYLACSRVEQSQFESIVPIPVFEDNGLTIQFKTIKRINEELAITLSPIRSETTWVGWRQGTKRTRISTNY